MLTRTYIPIFFYIYKYINILQYFLRLGNYRRRHEDMDIRKIQQYKGYNQDHFAL